VCCDGSEISNSVLGPATAWAKSLGLDVHLVYVAHPLDVETLEHPEALFADAVGKLEAEGLRAKAHVLHGNYVVGMIADFAEHRPAAMIAMSSHARTGFARVALGSTTMGVVGASPVPVLVTRPAG
jgi:nucleotide-binding universal stress UspA family protein